MNYARLSRIALSTCSYARPKSIHTRWSPSLRVTQPFLILRDMSTNRTKAKTNNSRSRPSRPDSTNAGPGTESQPPQASQEEGKKRKSISELIATHGPVFTVYWGSAYMLSLGAIYGGLLYTGPELGVTLAKACYLDSLVTLDANASTMVLAVVLNEAFELVRLPVVLATLPKVSRAWYALRGSNGEKGKSKVNQRANMVKEHGLFFIGYWSFLWACSGIGCYGAIELFGPDAAVSALKYCNIDGFIDLDALNPKYFNIGFAIAINELLEPIRFPFTLATLLPAKRVLGMDKPK